MAAQDPSKPTMTLREAAQKGGNATKERHGPDYYATIGRKGGARVAAERGSEFYQEIGRKGGQVRAEQSRQREAARGL